VDAIVVEGLRKRYGDVQALDGATFGVREGEIFGLLGPNGAGKSTTVRILVTLTQPDGGTAMVAGHDAVGDAGAVRRLIGYVPQESGVDRHATGRENLQLQGRVYGMKRADLRRRIDELLGIVGITDAADRTVDGYSGECAAASTLHSASSTGRASSFSTSRPLALTRRRASRCGRRSDGSRPRSRSRSCSRRTTSKRPTSLPTASPSCRRAGWSPKARRTSSSHG
jgi:ABC transporter